MYINNQHARGSKVFHEFTQVRIALIVASWLYDEVIIHKVTDDVGAGNILHINASAFRLRAISFGFGPSMGAAIFEFSKIVNTK